MVRHLWRLRQAAVHPFFAVLDDGGNAKSLLAAASRRASPNELNRGGGDGGGGEAAAAQMTHGGKHGLKRDRAAVADGGDDGDGGDGGDDRYPAPSWRDVDSPDCPYMAHAWCHAKATKQRDKVQSLT